MSTQAEEPGFIKVEDIIDIPKVFQRPRTKYDPEDEKALLENIEQESRDRSKPSGLRAPIGVCPAENITLLPQYKGKFFLFDGHYRLMAERKRGLKGFEVDKDVYIDRSIRTTEKLLEKAVRANIGRKGLDWDAQARYAEMFADNGWSQERIGDLFVLDRSTISKYLTIVKTLKDVKDDEFFGKLGHDVALVLCSVWGMKQWLRPYTEADMKKPQNEKGQVEVDVGRALFDRWKERGACPSAKTVRETVRQLQSGILLPHALGSMSFDNSVLGAEQRVDRALNNLNEKQTNPGSPPLPIRTTAELRQLLKDVERNAPKLFSNERYVLEVLRDSVDSFQKRLLNEGWKSQSAEQLLDTVNGFLFQLRNSLEGLVTQSKERENREKLSEKPPLPNVGANGGAEPTFRGIRKSFSSGKKTANPVS
ncbi:MAG: ParB/RepB/Spo0J family partition protein [Nitrososphaerota archaeon]|nr:ParB/RepB/Spo0J family partition protein [Nitrososphaerota archaeon]MDG6942280.1 ParB/RepB/Spo0J family partition protein [Nitrososphaerota archaeon]MDG6942745.1 ParB/RepB/Spo0J family partition protein [Nitrososphaerota archaeon]MDG6948532.1 ParB/RepB/Spo0J family partition protein [Nitrososphaerota archaeon]MDG6950458.1 ParB/RepB/Spo0J family partition protein [Nitrososphaerota archaeon]